MAFSKKTPPIDMAQYVKTLQETLTNVKTVADPYLLNDLKKVFKKTIPLSMRSYTGAYLAMCAMQHTGKSFSHSYEHYDHSKKFNHFQDKQDKQDNNDLQGFEQAHEKPFFAPRQPRKQVMIDPSVAKSIFINVGKNRHTFTKDIVGLLCSVAQLSNDRIGKIKVMPNYSFVELFAEDAQKAITLLNGYEYKRRPLMVSYSTPRQEKDVEAKEATTNDTTQQDPPASFEQQAQG